MRNYWFFSEYDANGVLISSDTNVLSNSAYDSFSAALSNVMSQRLCMTREVLSGVERVFKLTNQRSIINAAPQSNHIGDFITPQIIKFTISNLDEQNATPIVKKRRKQPRYSF